MTNSHLLIIMQEAGLSPEELSRRIDVSNMTLRRWLEKPAKSKLPDLYARELRRAVYELISEGRLAADSAAIQQVLMTEEFSSARAAIKGLGLSGSFLKGNGSSSEESIATGLAQIGSNSKRTDRVNKDMKHILSFKKFGGEWSERIGFLTGIIKNRGISNADKYVAYGSLFYLIYPFDFLPDFMPVMGYLDDFAMLGIAVGFLTRTNKNK